MRAVYLLAVCCLLSSCMTAEEMERTQRAADGMKSAQQTWQAGQPKPQEMTRPQASVPEVCHKIDLGNGYSEIDCH